MTEDRHSKKLYPSPVPQNEEQTEAKTLRRHKSCKILNS